MRRVLIPILVLQFAGCASNEALFAQYERPCPPARPVPAMALAVALVPGEDAESIEPAVFFDYRSAELDVGARETLALVVELLDTRPDVHLFLRAQTDWRGSRAVNDALAEQRLGTVREALLEAGVGAGRMRGVGIGERETPEGATAPVMDASRRVDLEFVDANGRPLPIRLAASGAAG